MAGTEIRTGEGELVRALILGTVTGTLMRKDCPVRIRGVEEYVDDDEIVQAVSVVTGSGLRYRVSVVYEGQEPEET